MMEFLQISIGEIKRKMKKKKIASYGSRFDEEMSKIGRFGNGGTSQGGRGCAGVSEKRGIYRPGRIVIDYKYW